MNEALYDVLVKFRIHAKNGDEAVKHIRKRITPIDKNSDGFDDELFDIEFLEVEKEEYGVV
jgi:hypothetical protein